MQKLLGYPRYLAAGLTLTLLFSLSACGFHLRGDVKLATQLNQVFFQGADVYDPLVREWTRSLTTAGSTVVEDRQGATAIIHIQKNSGDRRVLSVGSDGKVREYELYQALDFSVRDAGGRELLGVQTLMLTRTYLFDSNDVLGKASEEESLRRDMRRDLVRLAMLRLEALGR
jgi:LPS-assembly lipoprotein